MQLIDGRAVWFKVLMDGYLISVVAIATHPHVYMYIQVYMCTCFILIYSGLFCFILIYSGLFWFILVSVISLNYHQMH